MELIAAGRDADVFALDANRVLRRYRREADTRHEALIMEYVREHGFPVPEVHNADGRDLVMERLRGRPMLKVVISKPWQLRQHSNMLAALLDDLHEIKAPAWASTTLRGQDVTRNNGDQRILHLDLHPDNIILTAAGPVVIDWSNAAAGDPALDTAFTYLTLAAAEVPGRPVQRGAVGAFRSLLVRRLRKRWADDVPAALQHAAEIRTTDPNFSEAENRRVRAAANLS